MPNFCHRLIQGNPPSLGKRGGNAELGTSLVVDGVQVKRVMRWEWIDGHFETFDSHPNVSATETFEYVFILNPMVDEIFELFSGIVALDFARSFSDDKNQMSLASLKIAERIFTAAIGFSQKETLAAWQKFLGMYRF